LATGRHRAHQHWTAAPPAPPRDGGGLQGRPGPPGETRSSGSRGTEEDSGVPRPGGVGSQVVSPTGCGRTRRFGRLTRRPQAPRAVGRCTGRQREGDTCTPTVATRRTPGLAVSWTLRRLPASRSHFEGLEMFDRQERSDARRGQSAEGRGRRGPTANSSIRGANALRPERRPRRPPWRARRAIRAVHGEGLFGRSTGGSRGGLR